jgi:hypothetical protein
MVTMAPIGVNISRTLKSPIACKSNRRKGFQPITKIHITPNDSTQGIFAVTTVVNDKTLCFYSIVVSGSLVDIVGDVNTLRDYGEAVKKVFVHALTIRKRCLVGVVAEEEKRFDADEDAFRFKDICDVRFFVRLHIADGRGWSKMHVQTQSGWEKQRENRF